MVNGLEEGMNEEQKFKTIHQKIKMINVGVIGIGHLGSIHLKLLLESDSFKVIGCFDKNTSLKSKINSDVCRNR